MFRFISLLFVTCSIGLPAMSAKSFADRPKLVLVIVIDQFRADYLTRFGAGFGKGGFRTLTEGGAWYPAAQYHLLQNMTGPGHATILSGAYPALTGIPVNDWFDREKAKGVYCVEGMSPANFVGTTVGDELKNVSPASRVVAIAVKDRAAILLGGRRADVALWVDATKNRWVTSDYYAPKIPAWAEAAKLPTEPAHSGKAFLPGLALTEDMVTRAVIGMDLGRGKAVDLLAVSFSSHDYAGHAYGPQNPVMEEMVKAEDAILARLFTLLANRVPGGMKNVLVVLTADHGVASNPEWTAMQKIPAGRIDEEKIKQGNPAIIGVKDLNFYLKPDSAPEVAEELKKKLLAMPGIAHAFTRADYEARKLPPGIFAEQILNSYYPGRSGDVVAIPQPYFISGDETANHQTGYSYDRTVPIIFAGKHIAAGVHAESAEPIDIAPTLSFLLGTVPPSQTHGRVLAEILGK